MLHVSCFTVTLLWENIANKHRASSETVASGIGQQYSQSKGEFRGSLWLRTKSTKDKDPRTKKSLHSLPPQTDFQKQRSQDKPVGPSLPVRGFAEMVHHACLSCRMLIAELRWVRPPEYFRPGLTPLCREACAYWAPSTPSPVS